MEEAVVATLDRLKKRIEKQKQFVLQAEKDYRYDENMLWKIEQEISFQNGLQMAYMMFKKMLDNCKEKGDKS